MGLSYPLLAASVFWLLGSTSQASGRNDFTPRTQADVLRIQERTKSVLPQAKRATVAVLGSGSGSGVIISREGMILTAGHVAGKPGSTLHIILPNGQIRKATSLGRVKFADAGLLKITQPGSYDFARMAEPGSVSLGSWCLALGHPGGRDAERGTVARIGRVISLSRHTLRSDCKLIGGDSGGPLFDLEGRVIGIHSRISLSPEQNYHVPITAFHEYWSSMLALKELDRPFMSFFTRHWARHGRGRRQ